MKSAHGTGHLCPLEVTRRMAETYPHALEGGCAQCSWSHDLSPRFVESRFDLSSRSGAYGWTDPLRTMLCPSMVIVSLCQLFFPQTYVSSLQNRSAVAHTYLHS